MAKLGLVIFIAAALVTAVATDWRVVVLMLGAWWADNILRRLMERDL